MIDDTIVGTQVPSLLLVSDDADDDLEVRDDVIDDERDVKSNCAAFSAESSAAGADASSGSIRVTLSSAALILLSFVLSLAAASLPLLWSCCGSFVAALFSEIVLSDVSVGG